MDNKYSIYRLMGRRVRLEPMDGSEAVTGLCNSVVRDIMRHEIDLRIDHVNYRFREPDAVLHDRFGVYFVSGDWKLEDLENGKKPHVIRVMFCKAGTAAARRGISHKGVTRTDKTGRQPISLKSRKTKS